MEGMLIPTYCFGSNNRDREMLPFRFFCGNGDSSLAGLQTESLTLKQGFRFGQCPRRKAGPQPLSF
jgi:hypothetical protein